jgi:hypothetical protein
MEKLLGQSIWQHHFTRNNKIGNILLFFYEAPRKVAASAYRRH